MSRPLLILLVVLVIFIGGLFLFAGMAHEKTPVHVEKAVNLANLQG